MRAYVFSTLFHLGFAVLLVLVAISPKKVVVPQNIESVFLVASVPSIPVSKVETTQERRSPEAPPEDFTESVPPEKSLAERVRERLSERAVARSPSPEDRLSRSENQETPQNSERNQETKPVEGGTFVESEPDFPDAWYLALLSRRLTDGWSPPREGLGVLKREVMVSFVIYRDGRIKNAGLLRPSGNVRFDRAGLAAVSNIIRLPPLPSSWLKDSLQVTVRFRER